MRTSQGFLSYWRPPPARAGHENARDFLLANADLFSDSLNDLQVLKEDAGTTRLQQLCDGVPVLGAEFIVQAEGGQVQCVFADSASGLRALNCRPTLSADSAKFAALAATKRLFPGYALQANEPTLQVHAPALLGNSGPPCLVWQVVVEKANAPVTIREMVLVDAHHGSVTCRIPLIHAARNREVRNAESTANLPGIIARGESDPPTGDFDVDRAHQYLGDAYDFFWEHHGRDSIDGAGSTLRISAHVCIGEEPCPYRNAVWTGSRILLGSGYAKDDIIAHELAHGFTDATSGLYYLNESGALNEAFSDMWGEWIDMSNGDADDTPAVRWVIAEEFGGFRYMANPPLRGDPDQYQGPNWWSASGDHGGVHTNSGVANKLCYLLTDGDDFNGQTVPGLGIAKTADLMYEVQTKLLTRAASYYDFYAALGQAAINLGFSNGERAAIEAASIAVNIKPLPAAVTNFVATGDPATSTLTLRWQNPPLANFEFVVVRRSTTDFPAAIDDGEVVYVGSAQITTDDNLTPGTRYFYSAWADHGDDGQSIAIHTTAIANQETPTQSFTEFFSSDFDLAHSSITFRPTDDIDRYAAFAESANDFPVDPWTGTPLTLTKNDSIEVILDNVTIPFFGNDYDRIHVSSNGFVTFGASDSDFSPTIADHFARPRIAVAWANLDPGIGSEMIYAQQLNDRMVVSWIGVPRADTPDVNNFQLEMFFSGEIRMTWLWMDLPTGLVGLSDGAGTPLNYFRSDLSSLLDGLRVVPMTLARSGHNLGVSNTGNAAIDLDYSSSAPWLNVQGPSNLGPGVESSILVTVEGAPPPGIHDADIEITNLASGAIHHRSIRLDTRIPRDLIAEFLLDSDPGWDREGAWAYGLPDGHGTANGDPTVAYTGDALLGYNLDGDYPNNLGSIHYLTSVPIDCRHFENISLEFWVWHGIEGPQFDHANIQVSVDGETWTDVWNNPGGNRSDWAWHLETYDLPALVDGEDQVQIRWGVGTTDGGLTFCGWNLDDIRLRGDPAANSAPVVTALSITTFEDQRVEFSVAVSDAEGDSYSLSSGIPSHGSATTSSYLPDPNFFGSDSFLITANDGSDSGSAMVQVTVLPVNDPPVFLPPSRLQIDEDTIGHFTPEATDIDGDSLTFSVAIDPRSGSATASDYTPDPDFFGVDGFILVVSDGQGGIDTAVVNVLIRPVADPPINQSPPSLQGLIVAGETLTAQPGSWLPAPQDPPGPITFSYSWLRDSAEFATGPTVTLSADEIDHQLSLRVSANGVAALTTPETRVGWQFQFGAIRLGMRANVPPADPLLDPTVPTDAWQPFAESATWRIAPPAESAISWAAPPVDFLTVYDRSGAPTTLRMHETSEATLSPGESVIRFGPGISEIIVLNEGWNLIGLPLQPLDTRPSSLFLESWPLLTPQLWRWENSEVATVESLEAFTGYWIHSPRRVIARIEGLPLPFAKTIGPGWNSVSPAASGAIPANWREIGPVLYCNRTQRTATSLDRRLGYWVHGGETGRELTDD